MNHANHNLRTAIDKGIDGSILLEQTNRIHTRENADCTSQPNLLVLTAPAAGQSLAPIPQSPPDDAPQSRTSNQPYQPAQFLPPTDECVHYDCKSVQSLLELLFPPNVEIPNSTIPFPRYLF